MFRLVSEAGQALADLRAVETYRYPPVLLMEQASAALAARIANIGSGPIAVLAGAGNNGGDAWGVARYLHLCGKDVHVLVWEEPRTAECRIFSEMARAVGTKHSVAENLRAHEILRRSPLWIDGIYGSGFKPPVRPAMTGLWDELLRLRAELRPNVVAIDVPSGLSAVSTLGDPVLSADVTLSTGWRKTSCFRPGARGFCGKIEVVSLGYPEVVPADAEGLEACDLRALLPSLPAGAHKGTRGRVLVVGGAEGMTGAPVLAARSAAAAGAGLVFLWADAEIVPLISGQVPAFQVRSDAPHSQDRLPTSCVVGPGWGRASTRPESLARVLDLGVPTVIDADGLAAWSSLRRAGYVPDSPQRLVFTPHPGEMRQLLDGADPTFERALSWSESEKVTLVLKDSATWIFTPGHLPTVLDGQNPALGTGGSGDCLAGVLAGLLCRGLSPNQAAKSGVLLHLLAGEALSHDKGWFTSDGLPEAVARLGWQVSQN